MSERQVNEPRTSGVGLAARTDDLDPTLEEALEQGPLAPCPPQLEVDLSGRVDVHPYTVVADLNVDAFDRALMAAIEAVGQAQERGQLGDSLLALGGQRCERFV